MERHAVSHRTVWRLTTVRTVGLYMLPRVVVVLSIWAGLRDCQPLYLPAVPPAGACACLVQVHVRLILK